MSIQYLNDNWPSFNFFYNGTKISYIKGCDMVIFPFSTEKDDITYYQILHERDHMNKLNFTLSGFYLDNMYSLYIHKVSEILSQPRENVQERLDQLFMIRNIISIYTESLRDVLETTAYIRVNEELLIAQKVEAAAITFKKIIGSECLHNSVTSQYLKINQRMASYCSEGRLSSENAILLSCLPQAIALMLPPPYPLSSEPVSTTSQYKEFITKGGSNSKNATEYNIADVEYGLSTNPFTSPKRMFELSVEFIEKNLDDLIEMESDQIVDIVIKNCLGIAGGEWINMLNNHLNQLFFIKREYIRLIETNPPIIALLPNIGIIKLKSPDIDILKTVNLLFFLLWNNAWPLNIINKALLKNSNPHHVA